MTCKNTTKFRNMQTKEKKICSFTQNGTRLQLVQVLVLNQEQLKMGSIYADKTIYQVRLNRKVISSSISEYNERKVFATYAGNIVLQLKIY